MPSKTLKQHNLMAMSSSPKGRAKLRAEGRRVPSLAVAQEFLHADRGRHFPKSHTASHQPGRRQEISW